MPKNLTKEQWKEVIKIYKNEGIQDAVSFYINFKPIKYKDRAWEKELKIRIRKKSKLLDNIGMKALDRKPGSGRKKKIDNSDIPKLIDGFNDEQKEEIITRWIIEQRKKKEKKKESQTYKTFSISEKSKIWKIHRSTFYKKSKQRKYKFSDLKWRVNDIWNDSKMIYGSRKICVILEGQGIKISDRTLRNYMKRWGFITKTRVAKRKAESKNTNVKIADLVNRNFNPSIDNIISSDVSYIPANVKQNNIYLSVAISHKTKLIESWKLSKSNNSDLVVKTIEDLKRKSFIFHTDHGSQYSSSDVLKKLKNLNAKSSMSRVGNSLDNREIEYFFSCLKGEYLNHINTHNMSYDEIKKHIEWYINWYNKKRIQKRLLWQAPSSVSQYAI